jgi:hypothetical protein
VAAKAGYIVELYAAGCGPTNPAVPAGHAFSGAAWAVDAVNVKIGTWNVTPSFAGLSGAGLVQIDLTIPGGLGTGDVPLVAAVGGSQTLSTVVISPPHVHRQGPSALSATGTSHIPGLQKTSGVSSHYPMKGSFPHAFDLPFCFDAGLGPVRRGSDLYD